MPPRLDLDGYLRRLGIADPGPPCPEGLRLLHAAHVERIPYEALEIQLGRPTTLDPYDSADRIVACRRGGYCYHLNGAFSILLAALGYEVVWHRGGVQNRSDPGPVGAIGNHLALTVHGLPDDRCPDGVWLADVGARCVHGHGLPSRPRDDRRLPGAPHVPLDVARIDQDASGRSR
jgi:N-hydroxyarylamine O-acetyltransferase